jgi:hypothetical protein
MFPEPSVDVDDNNNPPGISYEVSGNKEGDPGIYSDDVYPVQI